MPNFRSSALTVLFEPSRMNLKPKSVARALRDITVVFPRPPTRPATRAIVRSRTTKLSNAHHVVARIPCRPQRARALCEQLAAVGSNGR